MPRVTILCLALLIACASTLAQAQSRSSGPLSGTPQEEAACRPDVTKFCRAVMPDTFQILSCLQANRPKLRKACQRVLANKGQ